MRPLIVLVVLLLLTPLADAKRMGCPERMRPFCQLEAPDDVSLPSIPDVPNVPDAPGDPLPDPDDPALPDPNGVPGVPAVPDPNAVPHPCDRLPDSIQNLGVLSPTIVGPFVEAWEHPRDQCHEILG